MTLDEKKEHILRYVKLGMDVLQSAYICECTDTEIDVLEEDPVFQRRVKAQNALKEMELLQRHDNVIVEAEARGNGGPIQWRLGIVNPDRYSGKEKSDKKNERPMQVSLTGVHPDGSRS